MRIKVHSDPQHPAGGYAFLELPGGSLPDQVAVAVQDAYSERWLHPQGDQVWQVQKHSLGSFAVHRHDGADWVRLDPQIVNRLEAYTPLRIEIDGQSYDTLWPDTVAPRAPRAAPGALKVTVPPPVVVSDVEAKLPPEDTEHEVENEVSEVRDEAPVRRYNPLWLAVLLILCAAGAAAWYFLSDPPPTADPAPLTPVAANADCTLTALQGLQGFDTQIAAVQDCGASVAPDTALTLIEEAAAAANPQALILFGTLYDGDQLAPRIENLTGLTFADDPARAAEYYARAAQAGSVEAGERLSAVCARLEGSSLTLEKGAFDDFCR